MPVDSDDQFDYYPRYRELRNRADSGGRLTSAESVELKRLQARLVEDSKSVGEMGQAATDLDEATGGEPVADVLFSPPTAPPQAQTDDEPVPTEDAGPLSPSVSDSDTSADSSLEDSTVRPFPRPPKPRPQSDDPFRPGYVDPTPPRDDRTVSDVLTPSLPPRPTETDDATGTVYDPTDSRYAGSGVWDHLPEVDPYELPRPPAPPSGSSAPTASSGGSGGGGGIPVPIPVAGGSDDGEGGERRAEEDPRGPWALEATTQARLTEIRDALTATGRGRRATGQDDDELDEDGKPKWQRDPVMQEALNALDLAALPGAGRNKSGQNLARYGQMVRGIGLRTVGKFRKLFGGGKKSKKDEDEVEETNDQSGKSKPRVDPKVVADVLGGGSSPAPSASSTAGGAGAGTTAGSAGAAAGTTATSGAAGAAEGALGGAGAATAGLAILAVAAFEAGKATYAFARAQEQEVRKLAQYGGQQAEGVARLDAGRTLRDVQTAQETGDSSKSLTSSLDAFEEKLRPIESLLTNIANTVGGRALDVLTQILTPITEGAKIANMIYDALPSAWKKDREQDEVPFDRLKMIHDETMRQNAPRFPMGPPNAPVPGAGMFDRF